MDLDLVSVPNPLAVGSRQTIPGCSCGSIMGLRFEPMSFSNPGQRGASDHAGRAFQSASRSFSSRITSRFFDPRRCAIVAIRM